MQTLPQTPLNAAGLDAARSFVVPTADLNDLTVTLLTAGDATAAWKVEYAPNYSRVLNPTNAEQAATWIDITTELQNMRTGWPNVTGVSTYDAQFGGAVPVPRAALRFTITPSAGTSSDTVTGIYAGSAQSPRI